MNRLYPSHCLTCTYTAYSVLESSRVTVTLDGVWETRFDGNHLIISYFDGEFNHDRIIPVIVLESFRVYETK